MPKMKKSTFVVKNGKLFNQIIHLMLIDKEQVGVLILSKSILVLSFIIQMLDTIVDCL